MSRKQLLVVALITAMIAAAIIQIIPAVRIFVGSVYALLWLVYVTYALIIRNI